MSQYRDYSIKQIPTDYSLLGDQTFKCPSECSCKFINDRTDYDIMQFREYASGSEPDLPVVKNFPTWSTRN
jgi:hypothetical protein